LVKKAHHEASGILTRAREDALEQEKRLQAKLQKEAVDLAVVMAKRLLSSVLTEKEQHALLTKRIADMESWAKKEAE
jgi:F0F1-type ATP synthase membrane subunit b/b'